MNFQKIQNYSIEECISLFGKSCINLEDYILAITGKINGKIHIGFIKILGKNNAGSYFIGIFNSFNLFEYSIVQVHSLTAIREEIFQFEDHLSFERSCFIILNEKFIRLKCVRSILCRWEHQKEGGCKISSRTKSQFKKCMQQIYTSYVRDLQSDIPKQKIFEILHKDIFDYLNDLNKLIHK